MNGVNQAQDVERSRFDHAAEAGKPYGYGNKTATRSPTGTDKVLGMAARRCDRCWLALSRKTDKRFHVRYQEDNALIVS